MTTTPASPRPTSALRVLDNVEIAREQRLVVVDGGAAAGSYRRAGQVVEVEDGGARAYVVVASSLAERPRLSFLLRTGRGAVTDRVAQVEVGQSIAATEPFGAGFPLERATGRRLLCCAAGSGIAAVRPVLHELAATRPTLEDVVLYYGIRTGAHLAFRAELEAFATRGLAVRVCLSAEAPQGAWDRAGWVQAVLQAEERSLAEAALVVAGPREMVRAVRELATAQGVPGERVLTNF